jgi:hypothetical protein
LDKKRATNRKVKVSIQVLLTVRLRRIQNIKRLLKYARDRIISTITKGYITGKIEGLLQFFKISSPGAVGIRHVFFLKT